MLKVHKHLDLFIESEDKGTKIDSYCCTKLQEKMYWNDSWVYCPYCGVKVVYGDSCITNHNIQERIRDFLEQSNSIISEKKDA